MNKESSRNGFLLKEEESLLLDNEKSLKFDRNAQNHNNSINNNNNLPSSPDFSTNHLLNSFLGNSRKQQLSEDQQTTNGLITSDSKDSPPSTIENTSSLKELKRNNKLNTNNNNNSKSFSSTASSQGFSNTSKKRFVSNSKTIITSSSSDAISDSTATAPAAANSTSASKSKTLTNKNHQILDDPLSKSGSSNNYCHSLYGDSTLDTVKEGTSSSLNMYNNRGAVGAGNTYGINSTNSNQLGYTSAPRGFVSTSQHNSNQLFVTSSSSFKQQQQQQQQQISSFGRCDEYSINFPFSQQQQQPRFIGSSKGLLSSHNQNCSSSLLLGNGENSNGQGFNSNLFMNNNYSMSNFHQFTKKSNNNTNNNNNSLAIGSSGISIPTSHLKQQSQVLDNNLDAFFNSSQQQIQMNCEDNQDLFPNVGLSEMYGFNSNADAAHAVDKSDEQLTIGEGLRQVRNKTLLGKSTFDKIDCIKNDDDKDNAENSSRGLRNLSLKVKQIVVNQVQTSYKVVADLLVDELRQQTTSHNKEEVQKDEQNIKRRVYDALNVLIAANVIEKKGKVVRSCEKSHLNGRCLQTENWKYVKQYESKLQEKRQELKMKEEKMRQYMWKYVALKQLIARNKRTEENSGQSQLSVDFLGNSQQYNQNHQEMSQKLNHLRETVPLLQDRILIDTIDDTTDDPSRYPAHKFYFPLLVIQADTAEQAKIIVKMSRDQRNGRFYSQKKMTVRADLDVLVQLDMQSQGRIEFARTCFDEDFPAEFFQNAFQKIEEDEKNQSSKKKNPV